MGAELTHGRRGTNSASDEDGGGKDRGGRLRWAQAANFTFYEDPRRAMLGGWYQGWAKGM
jgi:hypothetical protein